MQGGFIEKRPIIRNGTMRVLSAAILVSAYTIGCGGTPVNGDTDGTVSFSADVQPILNTYCFRCHRAGGIADQAGVAFRAGAEESYDLLVNRPSALDAQLTLVVPGDADASLLLDKVSSDSPMIGDRMPQGGPFLTESQIERIRDWIAQGAINN